MHNFICMGPRQHYTKRRPWLVAPVGRECLELVMSPVCIQYFERAWMQLRHCKNEPNIIIMVRSCSLRQNWSSKIAKQPADHMGASSPLIVCTYFCFLIPFQCLYYHIFYHWIWSEFIMWCPCLCLIKVEVPVSALILGCAPIGCGWAGDVPESTAESTVLQVGYGGMVGWWDGGRCHWWCYESDPTPDCWSCDYATFLRCLSGVVPHLLVFLQVLTY